MAHIATNDAFVRIRIRVLLGFMQAVTRAKQRLYLTVPLIGKLYGKEVALEHSRFLAKILPLAVDGPGTLVEQSMVSASANRRYGQLAEHAVDEDMGGWHV